MKELSPQKRRKVKRVRARIKKGTYNLSSKIVDQRTVDPLFRDLQNHAPC